MSVIVVGVNHRSAPLDVLERLAIAPEERAKAVSGLVQRDNIREVAVLSTCGRTELYLVAERFHGAYADATEFLADVGSLAVDELNPYLFTQHDDGAATHLFEVAAGLDSAVIGESEILGQVRSAWKLAHESGGLRSTLDLLFRRALRVGKRARSETAIGRGTASISHAAVEMATDRLGSLDGRRVLVVGAGDMGSGVATALHRAGAGRIVVANRTPARGAQLAEHVGGTVIGFDGLAAAFADADVAVTCAAGDTLITPELVTGRANDGDAALLIVDIAVPRNVDRAVGAIDGVTVLDLDDLRDWADRAIRTRAADADRVRAIVADELERFTLESTARQAAPLVARLRERAEEIRQGELRRHSSRLGQLDEAGLAAVDALTKAIVAKLLHSPSVRLRNDAGTPQGQRNAAAVSDLFELEVSDAAGAAADAAPLRLATRGSPQASTQAAAVADAVAAATGRRTELVIVETTGDRRATVPLHTIGGLGVFTKEVQLAVLDGRADAAVHSAKDLPTTTPDELAVGAFCARRDPADALVGGRLDDLAAGAIVATGSVRRRAQLAAARPDLSFVELRGNIARRLEQVPDRGAIVMAMAALDILGITDRVAERLDVDRFVPAVGQGCVAVECRADDAATLAALAAVDDAATRHAVEVERAFLAELGSGCSLPVAAHVAGAVLHVFLAASDTITPGEAPRVFRDAMAVTGDVATDAALARDARARPPGGRLVAVIRGFRREDLGTDRDIRRSGRRARRNRHHRRPDRQRRRGQR